MEKDGKTRIYTALPGDNIVWELYPGAGGYQNRIEGKGAGNVLERGDLFGEFGKLYRKPGKKIVFVSFNGRDFIADPNEVLGSELYSKIVRQLEDHKNQKGLTIIMR